MPTTPLAKTPYPSGSDAPAAAADMMRFLTHIDPKLVHDAVDEADRDARYSDGPKGILVVSGDVKKVWLKIADGTPRWIAIYEDTGWVDKGFTVAQGFEIGGHLRARRVNKVVELRAHLLRTGDAIKANQYTYPGNVADLNIIAVPAQFWPDAPTTVVMPFLSNVTAGTMSLTSSGNIAIRDAYPASEIANGDWVQFSTTFLQDKDI